MPITPSQPSKRPQSSSARIGALATLPVFFDLNGKPVLLIGGTEAATWKAELLAATGADIEVHALEFCHAMQALAARPDLNGSIVLVEQPWSLKAFANKSLIIGDAETEGEAKAVFCAARAAGVPVNVIDKPAYCTFKFGTIVNRSPVVIGISTDGAAPVLGQAIRTRIEALLPSTLANWAQLAKDIRATVLQRFAAGAERRQFWARFARFSFGPYSNDHLWNVELDSQPASSTGKVMVLNAPHSDPGLLTLNCVRLLQGADTIYFDRSVHPGVLDHARREAERHELQHPQGASSSFESLAVDIQSALVSGENILLVGVAETSDRGSADWLAEHLENIDVPVQWCNDKAKAKHQSEKFFPKRAIDNPLITGSMNS